MEIGTEAEVKQRGAVGDEGEGRGGRGKEGMKANIGGNAYDETQAGGRKAKGERGEGEWWMGEGEVEGEQRQGRTKDWRTVGKGMIQPAAAPSRTRREAPSASAGPRRRGAPMGRTSPVGGIQLTESYQSATAPHRAPPCPTAPCRAPPRPTAPHRVKAVRLG